MCLRNYISSGWRFHRARLLKYFREMSGLVESDQTFQQFVTLTNIEPSPNVDYIGMVKFTLWQPKINPVDHIPDYLKQSRIPFNKVVFKLVVFDAYVTTVKMGSYTSMSSFNTLKHFPCTIDNYIAHFTSILYCLNRALGESSVLIIFVCKNVQ